jgi:hypothetical protein
VSAGDLQYFVVLESVTGTVRQCWVDKHVAVGNEITLKNSDEPQRRWTVKWVSAQGRTVNDLGKQRGWHVGGL